MARLHSALSQFSFPFVVFESRVVSPLVTVLPFFCPLFVPLLFCAILLSPDVSVGGGPFSTARRALCRAAVTLALHRRREDVSVSLPGLFPIPYSLFRGASPRNSLVFFLLPIFSSLSVPPSPFSLSLFRSRCL